MYSLSELHATVLLAGLVLHCYHRRLILRNLLVTIKVCVWILVFLITKHLRLLLYRYLLTDNGDLILKQSHLLERFLPTHDHSRCVRFLMRKHTVDTALIWGFDFFAFREDTQYISLLILDNWWELFGIVVTRCLFECVQKLLEMLQSLLP